MTMENKNGGNPTKHTSKDNKQKRTTLTKLLLPIRTPNRVGVAMIRSFSEHRREYRRFEPDRSELNLPKSPIMVSRRPLSLDVSTISPKKGQPGSSPVSPDHGNRKQFLSPHDENQHYLEIGEFNQLRRCSSAEDTTRIEFVPFDETTFALCDRTLSHDTVVAVPVAIREPVVTVTGATGVTRPVTSANSLARKALMAAQVLHLIPTSKARQRNFLQGRVGANSLLGKRELEKTFPNRELHIFVGTWNMNGQAPPKELNDFVLPISMENVPDILVFGTQESCSERFEWEVCLQETIGPSHLLYHSVSLGTLHLTIFVRRDLIWYCSLPEEASISVRPGSAFKTKGAIASGFMLFGTSLLFVNTHLTAHQEKVKERVSDVKKIVNALDLPRTLPIRNKNKDVTQNFDYVFWSGDLNFRLATPRTKVLEWLSHTSFPLPPHLPHGYLHHDQLCSVLADGAAFRGFTEANITFPPSYKYDPGTQNFDTSSKQRAPAYTDRILFKHRQARRLSTQPDTTPLQCLVYDSVPSITTSDHKPVWGVFKAFVRPGIDTMPLAAGLFNRDVYLEGIKRRAASLGDSKEANMACSIQ